MELIDRYVDEVVGLLPRRTRAEAERELRERIAARLEGRAGEAAAEAVLRELGPPERAAADLRPGRDWLIAPHLKRPFVTALTISLSALGALTLARVLTGPGGVTGEEGTVLDLLLRLVSTLDDLAVTALLLVVSLVGIFVVVERTAEGEAGTARAWEPRSLVRKPEKDPDRVRWFGALLGIALGAAALVILHTYPVSLGATVNVGGVRGWVPLAVPAFRAELPWVDLWILASMALQGVLLWRGRRSAATHAAEAGLSLLAAWIVQRVRTGGQILSIDPERMAEHGWPADAVERYQEALGGPLQEVLEMTLPIVLVICLAEAALELYRAARAAWRQKAA
ncbi:MAG TPA: hypothetical protein VLF66_08330 [Thermoanaerobaculia bacterium]|nr:hypothetical protein [Thermoanaerobaculia bacterium]